MIDKIFVGLTASMVVILGVGIYAVWKETTFDYTVCDATEQYRQQHTAAYATSMKVGDIYIPQVHPAREWTERLYSCLNNELELFDKWRVENE